MKDKVKDALKKYAPQALKEAQEKFNRDVQAAWAAQRTLITETTRELGPPLSSQWTKGIKGWGKREIRSDPGKGGEEGANNAIAVIEVETDYDRGESKVQRIPIYAINKVKKKRMEIGWTYVTRSLRIEAYDESQEPLDEMGETALEESKQIARFLSEEPVELEPLKETIKNSETFAMFSKKMLVKEASEVSRQDKRNVVDIGKIYFLNEAKTFAAISEVFPDAGFPFENKDRYIRLAKDEVSEEYKPGTRISRSEVMKNIHKYFCRRCYIYNCMLHSNAEKVKVYSGISSPDYGQNSEPCTPLFCYKSKGLQGKRKAEEGKKEELNFSGTSTKVARSSLGYSSMEGESMSVSVEDHDAEDSDDSIECLTPGYGYIYDKPNQCSGLANQSSSKTEKDRIPEGWTDNEWKIYSLVKPIFRDNCCKIAKHILTKSCAKVHEVYALEGSEARSSCEKKRKRRQKNTASEGITRRWFKHCKDSGLLLGLPANSEFHPENQPLYFPCYHPGRSCAGDIETAEEYCSCRASRIPCEKFCFCSHDDKECENLFPGCQCQGSCDRNKKKCSCAIANRECDIDLCSCGLEKLAINPKEKVSCTNSSIQLRESKKVMYGNSNVVGLGLFAAEEIQPHALIGEYVGEIISHDESERRGEKYDQMKYTYLFTVGENATIDGMKFGNLMRFINSAPEDECNCYCLIKRVYGDLRIGIYADKTIAKETELFFDYMTVIHKQEKAAENLPASIRAGYAAKYPRIEGKDSDSNSDSDESME